MYIKTTKRNAVYNYEKFENHVKLLVIAKCMYYVYMWYVQYEIIHKGTEKKKSVVKSTI